MVIVKAGWFSAGCFRVIALASTSPAGKEPAEADLHRAEICVSDDPPRRLWIGGFAIDRSLINAGAYDLCIAAGSCPVRAPGDWDDPAEVTYRGAESYCRWRDRRLPSAAEWQKAARGTDDRMFFWGDDPDGMCRWVDFTDSDGVVQSRVLDCAGDPELPRKKRTMYGVEDMRGKHPQWTSDTEHRFELLPGRHRFSTVSSTKQDYSILELDWSSIRVKYRHPAVIDPVDQFTKVPGEQQLRGGASGWITGYAHPDSIPGTLDGHAAFRCAQNSAPHESPPDVIAPAADVFAEPFREPGFTPTPPAKTAP